MGRSVPTVSEMLGPGGFVAQVVGPRYESRPEQVRMAEDGLHGMREGLVVALEGPTGTGKTIAYLVSALLHAIETDQRVLVVVHLISLQEQVMRDGLPLVAAALRLAGVENDELVEDEAWGFLGRNDNRRIAPFSLLKGSRNYVCEREVDKLSDIIGGQSAQSLPPGVDLETATRLLEWTETAHDRADLDFEVTPALWDLVSLGAGQCRAKACPAFDECRFRQARRRNMRSRLVVTNYASLFSSIAAARTYGFSSVATKFDVLVCDEAHEMEAAARRYFGFNLSPRAFYRSSGRLSVKHRDLKDDLGAAVDRLFLDVRDWTLEVDSGFGVGVLRRAHGRIGPRMTTLDRVLELSTTVVKELQEEARDEDDDEKAVDKRKAARVLVALRDCVQEFHERDNDSRVYYVESDREKLTRVVAEELKPGERLQDEVWDVLNAGVLTSATLRASGSFKHLPEALGVPKDRWSATAYESPFDWNRNALLVIPDNCPNRDDDDDVARSVEAVVRASGGGVLVITTRWSAVETIVEHLQSCDLGVKVISQRDASRTEVVERFRDDVDSVLVGTTSMGTGIDVPGRSLRCVVVTKLPFPQQNRPDIVARGELGENTFQTISIVEADTNLRQRFGRLIRSKTDRGVAVILDDFIIRKPYGRGLLRSLPKGLYRTKNAICRDIKAIGPFLSGS